MTWQWCVFLSVFLSVGIVVVGIVKIVSMFR